LAERTAAAKEQPSRIRWVLGLGNGAMLILLVFASGVIEHDIRRQEEVSKILRQQADLIERARDPIITRNVTVRFCIGTMVLRLSMASAEKKLWAASAMNCSAQSAPRAQLKSRLRYHKSVRGRGN